MASNICLGCRFGSVKIEILVPEKYTIKEFAQQTQDFASEIIAITKEKPMHYSLTFGSGNDFSKLDFKIHCSCILNIDKKQCSKFNSTMQKDCKIQHFIYSKEATAKKIELQVHE
jgi:hypothetical protein